MMAKKSEIGVATSTEIVMPHEGGPELLEVRRREMSGLAPGGAMVRVEAAGVSFAEVQMLGGRYFNQPRFPVVPGYAGDLLLR